MAKENNRFDTETLSEVEKYFNDPKGWSEMHGGAAEAARPEVLLVGRRLGQRLRRVHDAHETKRDEKITTASSETPQTSGPMTTSLIKDYLL